MVLWMAFTLLGDTFFGLTHLLGIAAIAIEVFRPAAQGRSPIAH
jgi:predicted small integral membrane protein